MQLVISSGHGKYIRGASGYLDEVNEARRVVDRVAEILRADGVGVITFHDDVSTTQSENLNRIVNFHNSKTRDFDVSVHFNAYQTTSKPMGTEVLYVSSTGLELAEVVVDEIANVGFINRGPKKRTDLAFLNGTEEPAILIETCFVDSKADADLYNSQFEAVCQGIAKGLNDSEGGEVGPEPPPTDIAWLTQAQITDICNLAANSEIADYAWRDRGKAPLGYTKGLAVMFAQSLAKLHARNSALVAMAQPIGTNDSDALDYYDVEATGEINVLRKLFVMLFGLGMRESSGNYTEGRDMSAENTTADTAEAGCFQQSWNSVYAASLNSESVAAEMEKLLDVYEDGAQPCYAEIWDEGITHKNTSSYGSGDGRAYQDLAKSCPAFATEMCGVGLRALYNHWGPVARHEVEMRPEAEALLNDVFDYMASEPATEPAEVNITVATKGNVIVTVNGQRVA